MIRGKNIWNLCIIDNIDFREETFAYDNIFDTTRKTTHATLRMVFQLSHPLSKIITESKLITDYYFYIGISIFIKDKLQKFEDTFGLLLNLYGENFEIQQVHEELWKNLKMKCQVEPLNVVILEPGDNSNNTENIYAAARIYFNNVGIDGIENLEIAYDKAIFRRFNILNEINIQPLLDVWHTLKAMCITLLIIFSGYGIYDLAAHFGIYYLDK